MPPPASEVLVDAPRPLSLRGNFAWTLAGTGVYLACQWGILVALARLGTPDQLGQFALGLAISAPILMFTNLGLRRLEATDAAREFRFGDYLALRFITNGAALAVILALTVASGYRVETARVVMAIAFAKTVEALSDAVYGCLQQNERMDRVAQSLMIRGVVSIASLPLVLHLTGSLLLGVLALAAGWMAVLAYHDLPAALALRPDLKWNLAPVKRLAWLALPLGAVMMLGSLESSIPSLAVEKTRGEAALGVFAALACFLAASNRVVSALGEAAGPRLASCHAGGDLAGFRRITRILLGAAAGIGALGVFVAMAWGRGLLTLLYGPAFAGEGRLFVVLMVAVTVANVQTVLQYSMTAARQIRVQPVIFGIATALNVLLCLWLVPWLGVVGAGWALTGVYVFETAASVVVMRGSLLQPRVSEKPFLLRAT